MIKNSKRSKSELGNGGAGIAAYMLGFSLAYFVFYFIVNWIYDTKEERRLNAKEQVSVLRVVTKEEVMKHGIGTHIFKCYGIFSNDCRAEELYRDTRDASESTELQNKKKGKKAKKKEKQE